MILFTVGILPQLVKTWPKAAPPHDFMFRLKFAFCCFDKYHDQKQLDERAYLVIWYSLSEETKAGTWGSHLEAGTEAETSREVLTAVHTFPGMLS